MAVSFYNLPVEQFPMLNAFGAIILSLSCSGQSAPGTTFQTTTTHWQAIESLLAGLPANQFVGIAYGTIEQHPLYNNPTFKAFQNSWV
jgi:hypothetical protein